MWIGGGSARVPHLESYDALLEPLVHPAGINRDVNWSTLTWSMGTYHNATYLYAKDGPDHCTDPLPIHTRPPRQTLV